MEIHGVEFRYIKGHEYPFGIQGLGTHCSVNEFHWFTHDVMVFIHKWIRLVINQGFGHFMVPSDSENILFTYHKKVLTITINPTSGDFWIFPDYRIHDQLLPFIESYLKNGTVLCRII